MIIGELERRGFSVIREWIERNLGPAGQLERAVAGLASFGKLAGELPRLAERAERLSREFDAMGERGIRLDPDTVADIGRAEAREGRWGRLALVVIAVAVVIVALRFVF